MDCSIELQQHIRVLPFGVVLVHAHAIASRIEAACAINRDRIPGGRRAAF
jgi:hypothetical protein